MAQFVVLGSAFRGDGAGVTEFHRNTIHQPPANVPSVLEPQMQIGHSCKVERRYSALKNDSIRQV